MQHIRKITQIEKKMCTSHIATSKDLPRGRFSK